MALEDLYSMPGHLIRRCQQIAVSVFLDECGGFDITPIQYAVLSALEEGDGVDQITLAGLVALDRSTIANVVARLEGRDLVARATRPGDRRSKRVVLTAGGRTLLGDVESAVRSAQARMLAPLAPDEQAQFLGYLARLADVHNDLSRAPLRVRPARASR